MKGLLACRIRTGMTQAEAAAALGTDRTTVTKWETGVSFPRAESLPAIAKLYGCSIDDLYRDESERVCAFEGGTAV